MVVHHTESIPQNHTPCTTTPTLNHIISPRPYQHTETIQNTLRQKLKIRGSVGSSRVFILSLHEKASTGNWRYPQKILGFPAVKGKFFLQIMARVKRKDGKDEEAR